MIKFDYIYIQSNKFDKYAYKNVALFSSYNVYYDDDHDDDDDDDHHQG